MNHDSYPEFHPLLTTVFQRGFVEDAEGGQRPLSEAAIAYADGVALHELVGRFDRAVSLETGMAFGISSLFMCQAHAENGGGRHVAIDPYQEKWWRHIGELNLERAGLREYAELHVERSGAVLPRLMAEGLQLDVAFIDGSHRFDSALLDWFFVDRMLRTGGFVVLHDLWMPSIRKVISFILRNHGDQYEPVADFMLAPRRGLRKYGKALSYLRQEPRDVAAAFELAKYRFPNYAVLKKIRHLDDHDYDADWDYYRSF